MRKKVTVLIISVLLLLLSGCQTVMETAGTIVEKIGGYEEKPESEYIEFLETIPIGKGKLELVSDEYTGISGYTLQNTLGGKLYQWTNPGEAEHYSVLSFFEISDAPVELYLSEELTAKSSKIENTVVLSNDADTCRLYVSPLNWDTVAAEPVEKSIKLDWIQEQSHNLVYRGGYYAKEQSEDGWQIIYEVENQGWRGYVVKEFDFTVKKAYEFIYIEHTSLYEADRARRVVQSMEIMQPEITQVVFDKTIELREYQKQELSVTDFFEGNTYGLSLLDVKPNKRPLKENSTGEEKLVYEYDGTEYSVALEVVDTLAPEIEYTWDGKETVYLMPGELWKTEELANMFFTAKEESGKAMITLADGRQTLRISEKELGGNDCGELTFFVTDRYGNRCEISIPVTLVAEERIPEWYATFFDGTWDETAADAMERLICGVECAPEDYLEQLYEKRYISVHVSEEMVQDAVKSVQKLADAGLTIKIAPETDIGNVMLFYLNLGNVPLEILTEYAENGVIKAGYTRADDMKKFREIVITEEMQEDILAGKQKLEALGIVDTNKKIEDILFTVVEYASIAGCSEEIGLFYQEYVDSYDATTTSSLDFLALIAKNEKAVEGYTRLKKLGIDVVFESKEDAQNILAWFVDAANFPESLVQVYEEQEWDVTVPYKKLDLYLINNDFVFEQETLDAVEKGLSMIDGIETEYSEQMTFLGLARYYEELSELPIELFELCTKEQMVWNMSRSDMWNITNLDLGNYVVGACEFFAIVEKNDLNVEYPKQMTREFLRTCSDISQLPEHVLEFCMDKGMAIKEEDWPTQTRYSSYISWGPKLEEAFQKAKELKLDITAEQNIEFWVVSLFFTNLSGMSEEYLKICAALDTPFHLDKPGWMKCDAKECEKAVQGYQYLKDLKVKLKNSGSHAFDVAEFLGNVQEVPEAFWNIQAEIGLTLDIADRAIIAEAKADSKLLEEAYASMQQMEKLKLDIVYDKNVTMTEVIAFYRIMDDIPEEILKQYVSKGWDIEVECIDDWGYGTNYWMQGSVTQELYDRALSGYKKIKKLGITLKVLDEWEPIKMVSFYAGLDGVDEDILQEYADNNWNLVLNSLNSKKFAKKYDLDSEGMAGVTSYGDKVIEITSVCSTDFIDDIILHEFGHYIDYTNRTDDVWSSETNEFSQMYKKYKKKENGGNDDRGHVEDILQDIEKVVYRKYAFESQHEFFAESYNMYCAYPKQFKTNYPDVYEYLTNLLD